MSAYDVHGTLLDVHLDQDDLCMHLDTNAPWEDEEQAEPIAMVRLASCRDAAQALEQLHDNLGDFIYLSTLEEAGVVVGVLLEFDYDSDEIEITCGSVIQNRREYTLDEFRVRLQTLKSECKTNEDGRLAADTKYADLTGGLTKLLNNELDRSRRKLEFFRRTNSEKASEMVGRIAAYERVRMQMIESQKPKRMPFVAADSANSAKT